MRFKLGDEVRILSKTTGQALKYIRHRYVKGDIDTIVGWAGIHNQNYRLSRYPGSHFRGTDLEIADYQQMLTKRYRKHVICKKIT